MALSLHLDHLPRPLVEILGMLVAGDFAQIIEPLAELAAIWTGNALDFAVDLALGGDFDNDGVLG